MSGPGQVRDDNVRLMRTFIREQVDGVPVISGRLQTNGTYANQIVDGEPNKLWVTRVDNRAELIVWNYFVSEMNPGVGLLIRRNATGEWQVSDVDAQRIDISHREAASAMVGRPKAAELNPQVIAARLYRAGRLVIFVPGTLKVNFEEPFPYIDSNGDRAVWVPTEGNSLDLSANVPAASGGVDQWRWVQLALNPDATTPALVAFNGTAQLTTIPLDPQGWVEIAVTDGYKVLDALMLKTGDSDETTVTERRWVFAREFSGGGATGIDVSDGSTTVAGTEDILLDADDFTLTDASGTASIALKKPSSLKASDLATRYEPMTFDGEILFFDGDVLMYEVAN